MSDIFEPLDTRESLDTINSQVTAFDEGTWHGTPLHSYDALILDARLRQSLVTVRSLGSRGLGVAALETFKHVPTFSSRWCKRAFQAPSYEQNSCFYLNYLEQLLQQTRIGVLITSSDATVAVIRQQRANLERKMHIALASEEALHIALNKERTLEVARQLGVSIPRSVIVKSPNEVSSAIKEIGLPSIIKPVESWTWGKEHGVGLSCKLVITPEEAHRVAEVFTALNMPMLFQQYLSGRREAISFLYADNRVVARFAQWAKRTTPPLGGVSVLRQSIAIPADTGTQAEHLVREIALEGYSEVEFRRDEAGVPYLMEINPRLSASVEVAVRAGVDFPYLLYRWAKGDSLQLVEGYRVGRWMRYLAGDILTTLTTLQLRGRPDVSPPTKAIFEFCASFFVPMGYDYVDWNDPVPAAIAVVDFASYLAQRIHGKLLKVAFKSGEHHV